MFKEKNNNFSKLSKNHGFTLIEVMISVLIFSSIVVIAATTYGSTLAMERQSAAHRAVQQNGSFLLEYIGKEVRNGAINYAGYTASGTNLSLQPLNRLKLLYRGSTDLEEEIFLQSGRVQISRERVGQPGVFDTSSLTGDDVIIDQLDFYVSPNSACTESSCGGQQRVTIVARVRSNTIQSGSAQGVTLDFQTTYSVRLYDL